MKNIIRIFIAIPLLLSVFSVKAFDEVPQFTFFHDVSQFDVAGVKLGMTVKEAEAAIRTKLNVTDNEIRYDAYPRKNRVTNTKEPGYFVVKKGSMEVQVSFVPAVPLNPEDPMIVSLVSFKMPRTPENMASMQKLAFEKYGKPSNGVRKADREFTAYKWCYVEESKRPWGCVHSTGAKLSLNPPQLEMTDVSYQKAVNDYLNKLNSSTPEF